MNYWKQFAEMLGLELEQEFRLVNPDGTKIDNDLYKIREDGLFYKKRKDGAWLSEPSTTLSSLLQGLCKAVPKPWKPKYGEQYWSYSVKSRQACCGMFGEYVKDYACWKLGNCFKTSEEAQSKGKEIMEQIKKEYEEA